MNIISTLKQFGLSETEAKIYFELLNSLEAPVFKIAQKSDIPRTTTYKALESLKRSGFVMSFRKNNVLHYTPESPYRFIDILDNKKEKIQNIIPQILALTDRSPVKPIIKLYEGKKGIKTVRTDILDTLKNQKEKQLYAIANQNMYKLLPQFFPQWVEERVKYKIHSKLILPYSAKKDIEHFNQDSNISALREVKFLPPQIKHDCSVNIYHNKLAFFSLQKNNLCTVVIESHPAADMLRQFFLFVWSMISNE